ncbi:MAG: hypothetical protein M1540_08215 [Candidatus Bathyarchaeota archaeon]|nr:hypothetical protein [Candidatus Bathyarchaeota archaeon]
MSQPIFIAVDPRYDDLNTAMTNCQGGTLLLYPGVHAPSQAITWASGVSIMGSGRQNTIIRPTSGQIGILASGLYRCSLSHLTLDLSNITQTGVNLENCSELLFEDIAIITGSGSKTTAIKGTSLYRCNISHATLDLSNIASNGAGIKLIKCKETSLDDIAIVNVPSDVNGIIIQGQKEGNTAAYEMSSLNVIRGISISGQNYGQNQTGYGVRIIDSFNTRIENVKLYHPYIGIQLECSDTLENGGYTEGTSIRDVSITNPVSYGYRHLNARDPAVPGNPTANASFAFTRIEHMDINLHTAGSTGFYIPGATVDPLGTCTLDRCAVDQLNIWLHADNTVGIRLGCSADQLSFRNVILENFNNSSTCKGIVIDSTFGGKNIQWLQKPLIIGETYDEQIDDPYNLLDSKCFGFINKHVRNDSNDSPAIDRWYSDYGSDNNLTAEIDGSTGKIKAIDLTLGSGDSTVNLATGHTGNIRYIIPSGDDKTLGLGSVGHNLAYVDTDKIYVNEFRKLSDGTVWDLGQWQAGTVTTVTSPLTISSQSLVLNQSLISIGVGQISNWSTADLIVNSVKGTSSSGALKGGNEFTCAWDATYLQLVAHNKHLYLGTSTGKNVYIQRGLDIGTTLTLAGQAGSSGQVLTSQGSGNTPIWAPATWNGGTIAANLTISKTDPAITLACTAHKSYSLISYSDNKLYFTYTGTTNLATLDTNGDLWLLRHLYVNGGAAIQGTLGVNSTVTAGGLNLSNPSISNVTASRQLSVDRNSVYYSYYNNSGRAMLVHASVVITGTGANGYFSAQIILGWSSGYEAIANAQNDYCTRSNSFTFLVPNGWHYQIKDSSASGHNGGVTLQSVQEILL